MGPRPQYMFLNAGILKTTEKGTVINQVNSLEGPRPSSKAFHEGGGGVTTGRTNRGF